MIRAMTKSENSTGEDGDIHGRHGPIRTTYNRIIPKALGTWKPTVCKLGVPINDGTSLGGSPIGVMYQPSNIDIAHWNRSYSANTYLLHPEENLTVLTEEQATKISFLKKEELVATGVTLQNSSTIRARREVILSAGSIQSPGLHELSGIGQFEIIEKAGYRQVAAFTWRW
jgi:choline dehydrogenase-like flavoprotein